MSPDMLVLNRPNKTRINLSFELGAVFLMLLVLGVSLRFSGIYGNVLYADDYLYFVDHTNTIIEYDICRFPPQDYRWFSMANICLTGILANEFAISLWPKVLASINMAIFGLLGYCVIRKWGLSKTTSIIIPLMLTVHPIINEVTLWNITGPTGLILAGVVYSYILISWAKSNVHRFIGMFLLVMISITYEYSLVIFIVLTFSEPFLKYFHGRPIDIKKVVLLSCVFIAISLFYVFQNKLSAYLFPDPAGYRGVADLASIDVNYVDLIRRAKSLLNLTANVYMTPLSYYLPLERAWTLWKWIPIGILVVTSLTILVSSRSIVKTAIYSIFFATVSVLPLLPLLLSTQSPESWRVSIPSLLAASMLVLPLFIVIERCVSLKYFASLITMLALFLLANSAISEADLRVYEGRLEAKLLNEIHSYWIENEIDIEEIAVGRVRVLENILSISLHPAQKLSISYHRRGLHFAITEDIAWRARIIQDGMAVVELEKDDSTFAQKYSGKCTEEKCKYDLRDRVLFLCLNEPNLIQVETGLRIVHLNDQKVSAICI